MIKHLEKILPPITSYTHRVITCAGGLQEFWNLPYEGVSEVVNDLDGDISNFWMVLRNPDLFPSFKRGLEATPFSEALWQMAKEDLDKNNGANDTFLAACEPIKRAWLFFITCRQSMMGGGKTFAPLSKSRTRRSMNEQVSAWLTAIEGLPEVHNRLKRVVIKCKDVRVLLKEEDSKYSFFLLDPPYFPTTRTKALYKFEMTEADHIELLDLLNTIQGKAILFGYENPVYEEKLVTWKKFVVDRPNSMEKGDSKSMKRSCLWYNY